MTASSNVPGGEPAAATAVLADVVAGRGFHGDTGSATAEKAGMPGRTTAAPRSRSPPEKGPEHQPNAASSHADSVAQLRAELDRCTREPVVDLTAVTHLAGAAVAEFCQTTPGVGSEGFVRRARQRRPALAEPAPQTRDPHAGEDDRV